MMPSAPAFRTCELVGHSEVTVADAYEQAPMAAFLVSDSFMHIAELRSVPWVDSMPPAEEHEASAATNRVRTVCA